METPARFRRTRTKRAATPENPNGPLSPQALLQKKWDLAGVCCEPVTIGHFREQALVAIYKRHLGRTCAPMTDAMPVRVWRRGGKA